MCLIIDNDNAKGAIGQIYYHYTGGHKLWFLVSWEDLLKNNLSPTLKN